jgi:protein O-mannosyl-transferase
LAIAILTQSRRAVALRALTPIMRRNLLIALLLFGATFVVFSRLLVADFAGVDDEQSIYRNPHVQGLDRERLQWMLTDASYAVRYKPLTWLSYGLIYEVNGLNPFGYHLVSLLLHCANAVLMFGVIWELTALTRAPKEREGQELALAAALGALLWAVNPLRVEPLARVTDMAYCLSFFFLLISLWLSLRTPAGEEAGGRRKIYYWSSVGAFALAMLSYPFAFGYAVVLAVLDWYPLRRVNWARLKWQDRSTRRLLLEKIPFLLLGGLVLVTFFARLNPTGTWTELPSTRSLNPIKQGIQAVYVLVYYAWKPWLPFQLSPVYGTLIWFNPREWPFWSSVLAAGAVAALLLWKRRAWPWAMALAVVHVTLLLPALGLTEHAHNPFDRYSYMPGIVWAVLAAMVLGKVWTSGAWRTVTVSCALALAVFWGWLSFHQTRMWKTPEALFQYTIACLEERSPYQSIMHGYLATHYAEQGRVNEAAREYQSSLSIQPSVPGYWRLGLLLETNGIVEGALTNYLQLLNIYPDPQAHAKAAVLLAQCGRTAEAVEHYQQVLQLDVNSVLALNNLAWILATAPDATNRNGIAAVQLAERACALTDYQTPLLVGTLGAAYAEAGRFAEAIEKGEQASRLARAAGDAELADHNTELVKLYRSGHAFHSASTPPASK